MSALRRAQRSWQLQQPCHQMAIGEGLVLPSRYPIRYDDMPRNVGLRHNLHTRIRSMQYPNLCKSPLSRQTHALFLQACSLNCYYTLPKPSRSRGKLIPKTSYLFCVWVIRLCIYVSVSLLHEKYNTSLTRVASWHGLFQEAASTKQLPCAPIVALRFS